MSFSPSPGQEKALKDIVAWYAEWKKNKRKQEFYLAGYAGTGKSTIAEHALKKIGVENVRTGTYTGKAASVLRKKGVPGAQTIHSLIYKPVEDKDGKLKFIKSPVSDAASADLILLDECSMVDEQIAADLRSFRKPILIMGDPGQLPPIHGQGAFTNREPDAFLHEIHRQAADSPIIHLATLARQGKPLPLPYENGEVRVIRLSKQSAELIHRADTQVLCGLNKVRWKTTQMIRARLQHASAVDGGLLYEAPVKGERVICCKNNKELAIFNGLMGEIKKIDHGEEDDAPMLSFFEGENATDPWEMTVDMEDMGDVKVTVDPYLFGHHFTGGMTKPCTKKRIFNEFDWAYVITCHKAQGSQWEHVTVIDDADSFRDNREKWRYTALTRAATGLTVLVRP